MNTNKIANTINELTDDQEAVLDRLLDAGKYSDFHAQLKRISSDNEKAIKARAKEAMGGMFGNVLGQLDNISVKKEEFNIACHADYDYTGQGL